MLEVYMYVYCTFSSAQTKRPKTKRPKGHNVPRHNVPRDITSQDETSQDIRFQGQNVPRTKHPKGTKRPTLITKFSKTNFVLKNWPHMLGNGPHPCTQFVIGVFLFWRG